VATLLWRQYDLFHPERLPSTLNLCAAIQHFASVSGGPFCRSSSTKACQAFLVVQRKATCICYTFIPRVLKAAAASKVGRSGRFVKQEQWERWRAKRKLVSGSKQREWGGGGRGSVFELLGLYMQILQSSAFWPESASSQNCP